MPARQYNVPIGRVGRRFVYVLAMELTGVWQNSWNAESFIAFQTVILQHDQYVTISSAIRGRINRRLDAW